MAMAYYSNVSLEDYIVSQSTVNKIFSHIPTRTLLALATEKVIEWYSFQEDGRGINRTYRLENLYQIAIATQLSLTGFSYANIKELVMDKFFKGNDAEGIPKIYQYMPKLLGIKLGESKSLVGKFVDNKDREVESIRKYFLILKGKSKRVESRIALHEIIFADPENICALAEELNKPIECGSLLRFSPPLVDPNQLQPISILIINLPEIASRVKIKLESVLKETV